MTAILALAGALILAGAATFTFFGGYWWQLWTMKDNDDDALRTRIARILYSQNAYEDWNGNEMTWEETSQAYRECWLHDADVLIRELGSDCVYRYACHRCGDFWFDKSERMQRFALLHGKAHDDD